MEVPEISSSGGRISIVWHGNAKLKGVETLNKSALAQKSASGFPKTLGNLLVDEL
jgi:hypothetical protein